MKAASILEEDIEEAEDEEALIEDRDEAEEVVEEVGEGAVVVLGSRAITIRIRMMTVDSNIKIIIMTIPTQHLLTHRRPRSSNPSSRTPLRPPPILKIRSSPSTALLSSNILPTRSTRSSNTPSLLRQRHSFHTRCHICKRINNRTRMPMSHQARISIRRSSLRCNSFSSSSYNNNSKLKLKLKRNPNSNNTRPQFLFRAKLRFRIRTRTQQLLTTK